MCKVHKFLTFVERKVFGSIDGFFAHRYGDLGEGSDALAEFDGFIDEILSWED